MKTKLLLIPIFLILLTGCYNYRELDKLGITSAIGVTKVNDKYKLTIQVYSTEKSGNEKENSPNFITYSSEGKTIQEALRNVVTESSKRLYISHMNILIIDQEVAKDNINDVIDFFFRDPESRKQFNILIAKSNVDEILKTKTLLDKINAKSIDSTLDTNNEYLGSISKKTFAEFIEDYINPYKEVSLPTIELVDDKLVINNTSIFKDNKLIGFLNQKNSILLNTLNNKIDNTIITKEKDNKYTTLEIVESKSNLKIKDNNVIFNVEMSTNIADINYDIDLNNYDNIKLLEQEFSEYIKQELTNFITTINNQYKTDILGIKDNIYRNNPKELNDNLDIFNFNYTVETKLKIKAKGNGDDNIEINKN